MVFQSAGEKTEARRGKWGKGTHGQISSRQWRQARSQLPGRTGLKRTAVGCFLHDGGRASSPLLSRPLLSSELGQENCGMETGRKAELGQGVPAQSCLGQFLALVWRLGCTGMCWFCGHSIQERVARACGSSTSWKHLSPGHHKGP